MTNQSPVVNKLKVWAFPALVTVVGWLAIHTLHGIQEDMKAVKEDVKLLLAQSNIDKTRIDNLEREVYGHTKTASTETPRPAPEPGLPVKILLTEYILPKSELEIEDEFELEEA